MKIKAGMRTGELYCFRIDINVDYFMYYYDEDGCCQGEFEVSEDSLVMYLHDYFGDGAEAPDPMFGVFLVGDRLGATLKKYFRSVPSSKRVKT